MFAQVFAMLGVVTAVALFAMGQPLPAVAVLMGSVTVGVAAVRTARRRG